jgi:hypothetical protein
MVDQPKGAPTGLSNHTNINYPPTTFQSFLNTKKDFALSVYAPAAFSLMGEDVG